jgi:hypothetical protein
MATTVFYFKNIVVSSQSLMKFVAWSSTALSFHFRERVPPTDLSDVVDFRKILDLFDESGTTPPGIVKLEQEQFDRPVFTIAERPGMCMFTHHFVYQVDPTRYIWII